MKIYQYPAFILMLMMGFGCQQNTNHAGEINQAASLPEQIAFNKMGLKVITTMMNKRQSTMATLYGNDAALRYAASAEQGKPAAGMVFALLNWKQQEDSRWFGAKIPDSLLTVEILKTKVAETTGTSHPVIGAPVVNEYQCYLGQHGQKLVHQDVERENERIKYIFAQRASVMP